MSEKYLKNIEEQDYPNELKFVLDLLIQEWRDLASRIKILDKKIKDDSKNNETIQKIKQVHGVGVLIANIIYTELGDMSQFSNESKLFSFLGLTPTEYSSGERVRKGHISRQGPPRLRKILIEACWRNIQKDEVSKITFDRIAKTRGKKRAIVACARKLMGRIRASIRLDEDFKHQLV